MATGSTEQFSKCLCVGTHVNVNCHIMRLLKTTTAIVDGSSIRDLYVTISNYERYLILHIIKCLDCGLCDIGLRVVVRENTIPQRF